ncbi:hypothetical protein McpSp1_09670 [Methanocorpusculaceae archaeon Sp1]|nr:hypothetical protein [Methanocorpusculaceae archaeon Sp1]
MLFPLFVIFYPWFYSVKLRVLRAFPRSGEQAKGMRYVVAPSKTPSKITYRIYCPLSLVPLYPKEEYPKKFRSSSVVFRPL